MEWEELKNTWKEVTDAETPRFEVSEKALAQLISQRSRSLTDKMLRSFYGEILMVALCFLLVAFVPFPWYFRVASSLIMTLFLLPFFKPFLKFYRFLKNFHQRPIEDLHRTLQGQITMLRDYLRWYRRINLMLTPVAAFGVIWGLMYVFVEEKIIPERSNFVLLVTFVVSVAYALTSIPFVNWYVKRLYGQYLERLEVCLRELEEKNNQDL
ncbi:hypothetical protein [Runella aurantiaca]|uniref:Uncharacterized protein n=1 Tax=Runella aurantiaca TaxID=2282308 RepID=A0A369HY83_9BACT|nr:hypothetical protein [Runella aurantiaca]RDB02489.1 hypothetical protein DVG78_28620 [Runella aurantiaca]